MRCVMDLNDRCHGAPELLHARHRMLEKMCAVRNRKRCVFSNCNLWLRKFKPKVVESQPCRLVHWGHQKTLEVPI